MLRNIIYKISFLYFFFFLINGVFGVDGDEVKSVSVMEGDSVTLHTEINEILSRDHILWMFGPNETRIAEMYKQSIDMYDSNEIFGHRRLLLQSQGSLTIRNISIELSGLYKLQIRSDRGNSDRRFSVTVYVHLPDPLISRDPLQCSSSSSSSVSKCVLLCSVLNVRDVSLSWYKGNSLLSSISVSNLNIRLSLSLEVEYQDTNTYRCVVNNTITNQTQHLNINDLCQTCSEENVQMVMLAAVISLANLLIVLAVVMFIRYCKDKREPKKGFEPCDRAVETEIHYVDTVFCRQNEQKEKNGTEEIIYYRIVT